MPPSVSLYTKFQHVVCVRNAWFPSSFLLMLLNLNSNFNQDFTFSLIKYISLLTRPFEDLAKAPLKCIVRPWWHAQSKTGHVYHTPSPRLRDLHGRRDGKSVRARGQEAPEPVSSGEDTHSVTASKVVCSKPAQDHASLRTGEGMLTSHYSY